MISNPPASDIANKAASDCGLASDHPKFTVTGLMASAGRTSAARLVPDTEQTTLPRICPQSEMRHGDKMRDLEKMAARLFEIASKLPPGAEQQALLEQIMTFRIKLSAVAAKRKELPAK